MTRTEIETALTEVGQAVTAPEIDHLAFRARVRAERRRRTTGRALAATGIAAAVVTAAGVALSGTVGGGGADDSARVSDTTPQAPGARGLSETAWFVRGGELTALDPSGRLHGTGVASEGVVGFTSERVYALDRESRLVVRGVTYDDEGTGVATLTEETSPVTGAVSSVALSGDGRWLGWLDLSGTAHRYDLKAGRVDLRVEVGRNASLPDVSAEGLLVSDDGDLALHAAGSSIPVPVQGDGYGVASEVAMGQVLVQDRDGRSRLYDLTGGAAALVETFEGFAVLAPYAERVAVLDGEMSTLSVWDGEASPVSGIDGRVDMVRWMDERTLLATAHNAEGSALYACDLDLRCSVLPVDGELSF